MGEHGASCPARRQITHTNHTSMNYKYCIVCACQGMTSPLQSKVPSQNSCATGLDVPFRYTLFKVSTQLVCSWLSYSTQECENPGTSTTQHLQLTQFRCRRCRLDDTKGRSLAKKHPKIARFGTHFGGAYGILPRSGANHTQKPCIDELQILSSLYKPRHDYATAVKGATLEQLRNRFGCAFPI